jgi:DNA-binding response OmpR family regulator
MRAGSVRGWQDGGLHGHPCQFHPERSGAHREAQEEKVLVPQQAGQEEISLEVPVLTINLSNGMVSNDGMTIYLSPMRMALFHYLFQHRGKAVSVDKLMMHLYQLRQHEPEDKIVSIMVHHVRRKLRIIGLDIKTHRGFGYLLDLNPSVKVEVIHPPEFVYK